MNQLNIKIYGHVQGVFFRSETVKTAKSLNLTGWVKNCSDGSVEVLAEGEKTALEELEKWSSHGPKLAQVDKIEKKWSTIESYSFKDFSTKYL